MPQAKAVLFIHAQTPLHPGSGNATGGIDLPIQRERHTNWPVIPGSTLKGVLRDHARYKMTQKETFRELVESEQLAKSAPYENLDAADRDKKLECAFGPSRKGRDAETKRGSSAADFAGALAPLDMRLLLFPVRSLCGVFAWVTCPAVLERFRRDLELTTVGNLQIPPELTKSLPPEDKSEPARVIPGSPLTIPPSVPPNPVAPNMVLEEYDFIAEDSVQIERLAKTLADQLDLSRLATRIALISDDMFTHFVRNATEVSARIALDYETKTVSKNALFYVETIPAEAVFYAPLIVDPPKAKRGDPLPLPLQNEQEVIDYLERALHGANPTPAGTGQPSKGANGQAKTGDDAARKPAILQIGGEATTGKGLCRAFLWPGGEPGADEGQTAATPGAPTAPKGDHTMKQTREQGRAKAAWEALDDMRPAPNWKDFSGLCKQTIARVMNSGLLPALSYLDAKGKPPRDREPGESGDGGSASGPAGQNYNLKVALSGYLWGVLFRSPKPADSKIAKELLGHLIESPPVFLRRAQGEAIEYLEWMARSADGRVASERATPERSADTNQAAPENKAQTEAHDDEVNHHGKE